MGGCLQVAGARIVAESFPEFQYVLKLGSGEIVHSRQGASSVPNTGSRWLLAFAEA